MVRWALTVALATTALAGSSAAAAPSACFGAAARDPRHPCHDPRLDLSVTPPTSIAEITPNAPCEPIERDGPGFLGGGLKLCAFGVLPTRAAATVALLGDSHAQTWRAALDVVARDKGWRMLSITRAGCAFSRARVGVRQTGHQGCRPWNDRVLSWFREHPEVGIVFVAARSTTPVVVPRGASAFAVRVRGYRDAWHALPASVRHIVVLRDNPHIRVGTFDCIGRALRARRAPGRACALRRARALAADPQVAAAAGSRGRRAQTIDLTPFMCSPRMCFPVVGGALVDRDATHMTRAFATTLGPYLLRRLDVLMRAWDQ